MYAALDAFNLVPPKKKPRSLLQLVRATQAGENSPRISASLDDMADSHRAANDDRREFHQRMTEEYLKARKIHIDAEAANDPRASRGSMIDTMTDMANGLRNFGGVIVDGAEMLFEVMIRPIIALAWRAAISVFDVVATTVLRLIIEPVLSGVIALAVANPITATVLGIAGLVGLGYWAYNKFFTGEPVVPGGKPSPDGLTTSLVDPAQARVNAPGTGTTARASTAPRSTTPDTNQVSSYSPGQTAGSAGPQATTRKARFDAVKVDLARASKAAGVDPGIVARIANYESRGFDVNAQPVSKKTSLNTETAFNGVQAMSTAHGLGQFLDSTWLRMIREYGSKYGIPNAKNLTMKEANAYRTNVGIQSAMLAEFTRENVEKGRKLGGDDDKANVYAFHNLGDTGATRFLTALKDRPDARVDDVLSKKVIKGNPGLYGDGSITVAQAYANMSKAMIANDGDIYAVDIRAVNTDDVKVSSTTSVDTAKASMGAPIPIITPAPVQPFQQPPKAAPGVIGPTPVATSTEIVPGPGSTLVRVKT